MHQVVAEQREGLAELCRCYGVTRLEVFGSAARGVDFDPARSDVDFLVEFAPEVDLDLKRLLDMEEELGRLLGRSVDLVQRTAIEESRNYLRRKRILGDAELVYGN